MGKKSFGEEIIFLRKQRKWTQTDLAERVGAARSVISDYENGKTIPGPEEIRKFAGILEVEFKELLAKAEEGRKQTNEESFMAFRSEDDKLVNLGKIADAISVPILSQVHIGNSIITEAEIADVIKIPREIAEKADYAIVVKDMSMEEEDILPDDIILIKIQNDADNGQIVVARKDNKFTLKRLEKESNIIWLEPANSHYKAINLPFEIVGRVVYLIKKF